MRTTTPRRLPAALAAACALALTATACGSSDGESAGASAKDVRAALKKGGTVTVWTWEPTLKKAAADFEKKYPGVNVKLVNAGTGDKQYTALQNAMSAGSGAPDVAQIEYYALGQFALGKSVEDLAAYGAEKYGDSFSKGPWSAVRHGKAISALPMDSGPMALFYNKKVFDKHHIDVPRTWDEYVEAARKLHKADPDTYITADTGDAGTTTSLIWQAGGRPYRTKGTEVNVGFDDAGTRTYAKTWQRLLDKDLVSPVTTWTDDWYKGLGDGSIATLTMGAWMPANFTSNVKSAAGDWRVAPLPQWKKGDSASAENGGSSLAIPKAAKNKQLAYAFLQYAATGQGATSRIDSGAFPATRKHLESAAFLETKFPYFGGQKANKVFAESARRVGADWSYLPYQVYANSVFKDTVGKAYVSDTPLSKGFAAWEKKSVDHGKDQGFTVNE
ncbi:extracellular solute-binding protein [Streptomyces sp. NPDC048172]|uniref:ABC transporter substrate-binding protein n=1 Tax=Streptomyces sp. NPDC048172 TaxID=3365505 RepID=UPI003723CB3D